MSRNRFVQPDTAKVEISDGDYLILKKRLSNGEAIALNNAMYGSIPVARSKGKAAKQETVNVPIASDEWQIKRVLVWVVDWSLTLPDGTRAKVNRENVEALDEETGDEIQDAITAHEEALDAEKNSLTTPAI